MQSKKKCVKSNVYSRKSIRMRQFAYVKKICEYANKYVSEQTGPCLRDLESMHVTDFSMLCANSKLLLLLLYCFTSTVNI